MSKILVYSTILFDIIDNVPYIGGCHTNFATHCAMLGDDVTLISRVGKDELGGKALAWFADKCIHTEYVGVDPEYETGIVEVDLSDPADPKYVLKYPVAYDRISLTHEQLYQIQSEEYDFMYFGTVEQRSEISRNTLYQLLQTVHVKYRFFDINLRPDCFSLDDIRTSLRFTDILKMNEDEMHYLSEQFCDGLRDEAEIIARLKKTFDIDVVIVTKSEEGASIYRDADKADIPAVPNRVVDSVGAGDAFSAAFASFFARKEDLERSGKAGALLASYVIGKRSAVPEHDQILGQQLADLK